MHFTLAMLLIITFLAFLIGACKAFKPKCLACAYYTSFKLLFNLKKS